MPLWSRLFTLVAITAGVSCSMMFAEDSFLAEKGHHSRDTSSSSRHHRHHRGRRGPKGRRGKKGHTGPTGPTGTSGPQGIPGPTGASGQPVYADFYGVLESDGEGWGVDQYATVNFPSSGKQSGGFSWEIFPDSSDGGVRVPESGRYSIEVVFTTQPIEGDYNTYVTLATRDPSSPNFVEISNTQVLQKTLGQFVIKAIVDIDKDQLVCVLNESNNALYFALPDPSQHNFRHITLTKLGPVL